MLKEFLFLFLGDKKNQETDVVLLFCPAERKGIEKDEDSLFKRRGRREQNDAADAWSPFHDLFIQRDKQKAHHDSGQVQNQGGEEETDKNVAQQA